MVAQVLVDDAGDEAIAVVVAGMAAQRERLAGSGAGGLERPAVQLVGQVLVGQQLVGQALVDRMPCGYGAAVWVAISA